MRIVGIAVLLLVVVGAKAFSLGDLGGLSQIGNDIGMLKSGCIGVAADIVKNCFMKTMQQQKCDTSAVSSMFSGLSNLIGKRGFFGDLSNVVSQSGAGNVITSGKVDALTNLCNACTGCKMSAKQCVLEKAVTVQQGQCSIIDKLRGFVLGAI
ncbi:unnamed protein product [Calicophoron daubneyi]|uniref:Secreted protein n=1 Tax=Calicophoron daubneyi TaxID=300641 RepID=A0AAV2TLZ7_CALDB